MSAVEFKVAREVAEDELQRFADSFGLDFDVESDDEKAQLEGLKRPILRAVMRGKLVINDDGCPVFTPSSVDCGPLTIRRPVGSDFMGPADRAQSELAKSVAVLASVTGKDASLFGKMAMSDFKVLKALVLFFTAG